MKHQKPTLVAMGGNSLLDPKVRPTVAHQFEVTARATAPVADLIARGERVVLTHGNGPQVGFMLRRSDLARHEVHEVPLDSLVADTQGAIGYMIEHQLREALRTRRAAAPLATLVTEVEVAADDPAFGAPTKPIGRFYSADEARALIHENGWVMLDDAGRGWRRVVPSPRPLHIVEIDTIRILVHSGVTLITCGGGGIPVVRGPDQHLHGVEAVIDKDLASALLALELGLERLIITTGVDAIHVDWGRPTSRPLGDVSAAELAALSAAGQFPTGSMGPKVEAILHFLAHGGHQAIVCAPERLVDAWDGKAGTVVYKT